MMVVVIMITGRARHSVWEGWVSGKILFSGEEVLNSEKKCNYEKTKVLGMWSRKESHHNAGGIAWTKDLLFRIRGKRFGFGNKTK